VQSAQPVTEKRQKVQVAKSAPPDRKTAVAGENGQWGVLAVPKVRKAAREAGIDLKAVQPGGGHGQITLEDLRQYQAAQRVQPPIAAAPERVERQPSAVPAEIPDGAHEVAISRMRQTIGQRLGKSMQDAPHFYVTGEFDLEGVLTTLKSLPEPRPRINDVIQYLTVQTLGKVPELNATYENGHLYQYQAIHLAVAVAVDDGLITPVIQNADHYSLSGLAAESRALIERLRANRLRQQDLSAGTFTISNLGVVKEVEQFTAVINPPQVAILAVGTVKQRPFVLDGGLYVRHTVKLTLSGDHRVVDGMTLGKFMAAFQSEVVHFSQQN
jgi:pyruvate dehydrogenase E2 component (dihydrolipoyllysine-residue acetyltransferase)